MEKRAEHHTPAILLPGKKLHPLKRRLGSSDSLSGWFGEEFLAYAGIWTPGRPTRGLVSVLTTLPPQAYPKCKMRQTWMITVKQNTMVFKIVFWISSWPMLLCSDGERRGLRFEDRISAALLLPSVCSVRWLIASYNLADACGDNIRKW